MSFFPNKKRLLQAVSAAGMMAAAVLPLQAAEAVKDKPDGSWVSLSGKVVSHTPSMFTLDYGEGTIRVETDG